MIKFYMAVVMLLQQYSGAIQAIATIVLVLVTVYYAFQTGLAVKRMDETRKMEFLPIISINRLFVSESRNDEAQEINVVVFNVKNEGRGMAREVEVHFSFCERLSLGVVSVDEELTGLRVEFALKINILELPKNDRYVRIKYKDIFNRLIITEALIEELETSPRYKEPSVLSWKIILPM